MPRAGPELFHEDRDRRDLMVDALFIGRVTPEGHEHITNPNTEFPEYGMI
jgi:hypothetical protein